MKKTLFLLLLGCGLTGTQLFGANVLFDLNSVSGGMYDGATWNGVTAPLGTAQEHAGVFNQTGSGMMDAGSVYTSTGQKIADALSWSVVKTVGGGLWGTTGTVGTTPSAYQALPGDVMDSGFSFNNDARVQFTIGGLSAGSTYTLTFGGNGGMGQTTAVNFDFTDMVAGSLAGSGGIVSNSRFQVTNPNAASGYALTVQLTANDAGEISFSGQRNTNGNSLCNLTYMSLDGDFAVVPEPASSSLGLAGLAGLLMRRRKK